MMQLGRNDRCHCGSGKKYKKCHGTEMNGMTKSECTFYDFSQSDLFKITGALQLIPENHGKNIRFEILLKDILEKSAQSENEIKYSELTSFFSSNYTDHYLEDEPTNFFTENIMYFGGNYVVFPGLNTNGSRILNIYLEAIFNTKNQLAEGFYNKINEGTSFILKLSMLVATRAKLKRNIYENHHGKIQVPKESELTILKSIVTFSHSQFEELMGQLDISVDIVNEFLVDKNDADFSSINTEQNPFLKKPLIKLGEEYIFVLPTATVNCLIEFIVRTAREMNCLDNLFTAFYSRKWQKLVENASRMGWVHIESNLPAKNPQLPTIEGVFKFDFNKLAYVRLLLKIRFNEVADQNEKNTSDLYNKRTEQVVKYLIENDPKTDTVFSVDIHGTNGGNSSQHLISEAGVNHLEIGYFEFDVISLTEEIDELALWKFNKSLKLFQKRTLLISPGGIMDIYVHYRNNKCSFYNSDEIRPDSLMFSDVANDFVRKIYLKHDEHSAPTFYEKTYAGIPIHRLRDFAPIYQQNEDNYTHRIFVEGQYFFIWVKNFQARQRSHKSIIHFVGEALIFWLYKMERGLKKFINYKKVWLIEFETILDEGYFRDDGPLDPETNIPEFQIDLVVNVITISIPITLASFFLKHNNDGEKMLVKTALQGLNLFLSKLNEPELTEHQIADLTNEYLQPSNAKMIHLFDSKDNIIFHPEDLFNYRGIQEAEFEPLLDSLIDDLKIIDKKPRLISTKEEKIELSNEIVSVYFNKVKRALMEFDSVLLIKFLIKMHEDCVRSRKIRATQIPAKIACFSDYPTEVERLEKDNSYLVNASLGIRCLIEFIAAEPHFGIKTPNIDDYDYLMACQNQLINWGMISDGIDLNISDPTLEILPTGRIGIQREDEKLQLLAKAKAESMLYGFQQSSHQKLTPKKTPDSTSLPEIRSRHTEENRLLDEAFEDEYGISYTKIIELKLNSIEVGLRLGLSDVEIEENEFLGALLALKENVLTEQEIIVGLEFLSLNKRKKIEVAPKGFDKSDVYPWKYNRSLSFIRRPLIKIKKEDNRIFYYFGCRHVYSTIENLNSIIFKGRLKAKEGGLLSKFLAKINDQKGSEFRKVVFTWLTYQKSSLVAIPYEVKIKPKGHLNADKDYGDIDVLVIDKHNKIFFSIECKNTIEARVSHEMKTEMDKYLGRNGEEALIKKHVQRDKWLKENINTLSLFVNEPSSYTVKSLVLTSEELPILYLTQEKLPLPMLSFDRLAINGVTILNDLNFL